MSPFIKWLLKISNHVGVVLLLTWQGLPDISNKNPLKVHGIRQGSHLLAKLFFVGKILIMNLLPFTEKGYFY